MRFTYKWEGAKAGVLVAVLIIVLTGLGLFASLLQHLEYWALDYRFRLANKASATPEIVIVAIDDESIQKLGRWPWPRSYHARLIDVLNQAKARVIGLDIILSSPHPPEDHQLVRAIKNAQNVVMVAYPILPTQTSFNRNIMTVEHIEGPVEEMAQGAGGIGHIAMVYDNDGIVRRVPPLLRTKDKTLLTFGIEIALTYQQEPQRRIGLDDESLQVNSIRIPLDSRGNMLINYAGGPHSFAEIPYYRVIGGEVPPDVFKDRIVLVGITASGLAGSWATPFINQGEMSSVEINANVIHTILNKRFFSHLNGSQSALLILFLGIVSGLIFHKIPRLSMVFLIIMVLLIASVSFYLFLERQILMETVPLFAVLFATYISIILIKSREYKMEIWKREMEMSSVFEIGKIIKDAKGSEEEFLKSVCHVIKRLARVDVCCAILGPEERKIIGDGREIPGRLINHEMMQEVIETGRPILKDIRQKTSGASGVMYVPIKSVSHVYGALFLERKGSFGTRDLQLTSIFTDYMALILENRNMLHKKEAAYTQVVQALDNVIRLRYPYIHSHSGQVLNLTEKMAAILDIPKYEIGLIRYAAILHDLGMTRIPEEILNKSDPLTTEERLYLQSHPEITVEVIRPMIFLEAAIPIIRHHHERYDGKGYPDGLAGDEIPLGSQMLAVADSFVAMLSDRPYRWAREQGEAISEIRRQSGLQFDPRVVGALIQSLDGRGSNGQKNAS